MTRRGDRFTSRYQAVARFIAQRGLLKPVVWSIVSVKVEGAERIKKVGKSFVVVANHTSHLDAPLILGGLPAKKARYLAAGAAADYFFDVWWRRGLTSLFFNAFPVDRTGQNPRSVSARGLLQRGVPLLVFPEGTRQKSGEPGAFKPGAAALAASSGAPIIPVAIIGAYEAHPRGSSWPKPGRLPVGLIIDDPLYAEKDEPAVDFMERVRTEIVRLRAENRDRILSRGAAPEPTTASDPEDRAK